MHSPVGELGPGRRNDGQELSFMRKLFLQRGPGYQMEGVEKDGEARSKQSRTYVETNSGQILVPRDAPHWTVPFQATNMTYPHIAINLNHHRLQQGDFRSRSG